jgi:hypothetical protein
MCHCVLLTRSSLFSFLDLVKLLLVLILLAKISLFPLFTQSPLLHHLLHPLDNIRNMRNIMLGWRSDGGKNLANILKKLMPTRQEDFFAFANKESFSYVLLSLDFHRTSTTTTPSFSYLFFFLVGQGGTHTIPRWNINGSAWRLRLRSA